MVKQKTELFTKDEFIAYLSSSNIKTVKDYKAHRAILSISKKKEDKDIAYKLPACPHNIYDNFSWVDIKNSKNTATIETPKTQVYPDYLMLCKMIKQAKVKTETDYNELRDKITLPEYSQLETVYPKFINFNICKATSMFTSHTFIMSEVEFSQYLKDNNIKSESFYKKHRDELKTDNKLELLFKLPGKPVELYNNNNFWFEMKECFSETVSTKNNSIKHKIETKSKSEMPKSVFESIINAFNIDTDDIDALNEFILKYNSTESNKYTIPFDLEKSYGNLNLF